MSNKSARKTNKTRRDTAVQGTNDSSIVSKLSASDRGYFTDDFLKNFVTKGCRRSPIINRGYYVRSRAVDSVLKSFLGQYVNRSCQIISVGAGFDSTYFRLKSQGLLESSVYVEIDFKKLLLRKLRCIERSSELSQLLQPVSPTANSTNSIDSMNSIVYDSPGYKMLGVDLTNTTLLGECLTLAGVDATLPTLLLSEVVICYMQPAQSSQLISWAAQHFCRSMFVVYEQIKPFDAFGRFMCAHFLKLGSPLRSIESYPTLTSQVNRYLNLGYSRVTASDMNQYYYTMLSQEERCRVEGLESFDEQEEWHLKCSHYFILTAFSSLLIKEEENLAERIWSLAPLPIEADTESLYNFNYSSATKLNLEKVQTIHSLRQYIDAVTLVEESDEISKELISNPKLTHYGLSNPQPTLELKSVDLQKLLNEASNKSNHLAKQQQRVSNSIQLAENYESEIGKSIYKAPFEVKNHIGAAMNFDATAKNSFIFSRLGHSVNLVDLEEMGGKCLVIVGGFGLNEAGQHKRTDSLVVYRLGSDNDLKDSTKMVAIPCRPDCRKVVSNSAEQCGTLVKEPRPLFTGAQFESLADPLLMVPSDNADITCFNRDLSVPDESCKVLDICKETSIESSINSKEATLESAESKFDVAFQSCISTEFEISNRTDCLIISSVYERLYHTAVRLDERRILLFGGRQSPKGSFNDVVLLEFLPPKKFAAAGNALFNSVLGNDELPNLGDRNSVIEDQINDENIILGENKHKESKDVRCHKFVETLEDNKERKDVMVITPFERPTLENNIYSGIRDSSFATIELCTDLNSSYCCCSSNNSSVMLTSSIPLDKVQNLPTELPISPLEGHIPQVQDSNSTLLSLLQQSTASCCYGSLQTTASVLSLRKTSLSAASVLDKPSPRWRHTATFLESGKVNNVLGGGRGVGADMSESLGGIDGRGKAYNLIEGDRGLTPDLAKSHGGKSGGMMYVVGGRNEEALGEDSCWELNCDSWTWKQIGSPSIKSHTHRHSHTSDIWRMKLIISGGLADLDSKPLASISVLDLETLQCTLLPTSHQVQPRYSHTSAIVRENVLLLVGGVSLYGEVPGVTAVNLETGTLQDFSLHMNPPSVEPIVMLHNHAMIILEENATSTNGLVQEANATSAKDLVQEGNADCADDVVQEENANNLVQKEAISSNTENLNHNGVLRLGLFGGGGNCFSFGTHLNSQPIVIHLQLCESLLNHRSPAVDG